MPLTKQDIAERARGYIASGCWILDTETTAAPWINPDAEVCEIAIINASGTVEFSSLIKTVYPIDEETSKIHGITNEMCANAPTWSDIHSIIAGFMYDRPILAYNAPFDSGVIAKTVEMAGNDVSLINVARWGCLMAAYQHFAGYSKWQKLGVACAEIGYSLEGAHRAMADAKAARAILLHMAAHQSTEQQSLIDIPQIGGYGTEDV
jgi:DNA polymerase-3 subunit epsilon